MKKYLVLIASVLILSSAVSFADSKKTVTEEADGYITDLTTIDPEIMKLFPRWTICEPELKIQIRRAFVLAGYDKSKLDENKIEVIAIPKEPLDPDNPEPKAFELLHISCGKASMNATQINRYMKNLYPIIAGEDAFASKDWDMNMDYKRDYCFEDIPPDASLTEAEKGEIMDYLHPTNVYHAFTISLFEQSLKVGNSGFWLKNYFGNDDIGYPFWSSGDAKVVLKRPLYNNTDPATRKAIPYLIDATMGFGYSNKAGLKDDRSLLSWVPERKLNVYPGGKLLAGIDFSLPVHPQAGVHIGAEIPLTSLNDEAISSLDYFYYQSKQPLIWMQLPDNATPGENMIAPVLRESGQFTFFYNFWFGDKMPENYIRVDLGLSYYEVQEMAWYEVLEPNKTAPVRYLTMNNVQGLHLYKPNEFGDWLYMKVAYRNTASYPFSISLQYSNQILLSSAYLPLFSDWLLIEAKYARPLRSVRPFETNNFFMISPVLRLTI